MVKNLNKIIANVRENAKKYVEEAVEDDEKWNLFERQLELQGLNIRNYRDMARKEHGFMDVLATFYRVHVAVHICDQCDYCPRPRRGKKVYSKRKVYDCDWLKTEGDLLASYTGKIEFTKPDELPHTEEMLLDFLGCETHLEVFTAFLETYDKGEFSAQELLENTKTLTESLDNKWALYAFNNPVWKKAYKELSEIVLEKHTDRKQVPPWLNEETNICEHFYIDLSRTC